MERNGFSMWKGAKIISNLVWGATNALHWILSFFIKEEVLLNKKFLHLCWWFIKRDLPIPKYFVGVATAPSVSTQAATGVLSTQATGNGNITSDGGASITARGFVFSITSVNSDPTIGGTGVTNIVEGGTATGAFLDTLPSLAETTGYSYKAYATNSKGTGYGGVQTFTTLNASPTVALNTPSDSATGVSTTPTFEFTGTDSLGEDVSYQIQVHTGNVFSATPYDISTAIFNQISLSVAQDAGPSDMLFNDDGTVLYVLGFGSRAIREYILAIPYDISSGVYNRVALSSLESFPRSMLFNDDGTVLYIMGSDNDDIREWHLSTPYDISTGSPNPTPVLDVSGQQTRPTGMLFNDDGSILYVLGGDSSNSDQEINEYALSPAYDISSASFSQIALSLSSGPQSMKFNGDGTILYILDIASFVDEYSLSTPYDISSASFVQEALDTSTEETSCRALIFNPDGTILYIMGSTGDDINEYIIDSPLINKFSDTDTGFANTVSGGDTDPFNSGEKADYDVQAGDELTNSTLYYWRVRGQDPGGSTKYGAWSSTRSFTTQAVGGNVVKDIIGMGIIPFPR